MDEGGRWKSQREEGSAEGGGPLAMIVAVQFRHPSVLPRITRRVGICRAPGV